MAHKVVLLLQIVIAVLLKKEGPLFTTKTLKPIVHVAEG